MRADGLVAFAVLLLVSVAGQPVPPARPQAAGSARIAGRVVAADSGKPLPGAALRLLPSGVAAVARSAATDETGRFEFDGLAAGRYRLEARADGYLALGYGQRRPAEPGKVIELRDGERFESADFSLPRPGAIEGVLLDEFGDPAPNVTVSALRLEYVAGRRRLVPLETRSQTRPTDDKGRFRVPGLGPGAYYLCAGAMTVEGDTAGFQPTYYPGTTEAGAAQPISVPFGQDVMGVTFGLVAAKLARVAGRVIDASGAPVPKAMLLLTLSDRPGTIGFLMVRGATTADGGFAFRAVPPGSYVVQAFGRSLGTGGSVAHLEFGWRLVTVNEEDVTDLVVNVARGASARGRMLFEGDDLPRPAPDGVLLFPRPVEFNSAPIVGGGPPPQEMRDDWTFEVNNLSGLRVMQVDPRAPGWSLKRITLDGRDVTDTPLDFRGEDIEGLEVVLTSRAASVAGRVVDEEGAPVPDYAAIVFAADRDHWAFPSRFVHLARPSQDGRFEIRALPAETYRAIALASVAGTTWQDPEFLERHWADATSLVVSEGEAKTVVLTLVRPVRQ